LIAGLAEGEFSATDRAGSQFHQGKMSKNGRMPKTWILLDNQSAVDVSTMKSCCATSVVPMGAWTSTAVQE